MRIFVWLFRALVFFTLFAFALNNQHEVVVRWFFGVDWRAPMVFVVLGAFALGCAFGVVAMLPGWWRRRAAPRRADGADTAPMKPVELAPSHPPRDGL